MRHLIEVKWKEAALSSSLQKFQKLFPQATVTQLVGDLADEKTYPSGVQVRQASKWLSLLPLNLKKSEKSNPD